MKAKNTDKLERENRQLKRQVATLEKENEGLRRENKRLEVAVDVAESREEKRLGMI